MPIPQPKKGQSEKDYVSMCMGSKIMLKEFPDKKQRSAVCYNTYRTKDSIGLIKGIMNSLYGTMSFTDEFGESFQWALPIMQKYEDQQGHWIKGVALNVGKSRNLTNYELIELQLAARTLIGKPLLVNHTARRAGYVDDAEFEDGKIEYIANVTDTYFWNMIQKGEIEHVSPLGIPRYWKRTPEEVKLTLLGKRAGTPKGIIFDELSLIVSPEKAGDLGTSVLVMESVTNLIIGISRTKFEGELKIVEQRR